MMFIRAVTLLLFAWLALCPALVRAVEPGDAPPESTAESAEDADDAVAEVSLPQAIQNQAQYRIGPGDIIAVQVYGERDLTGAYPVSSSGDLDFPLTGVLQVDGLTTGDVSAMLRERLMQGFLNNPHVTVSVETYASQPVQVLGAVSKPGLYFLQGPTTVLQILSLAGGVNSEGVNEVRVAQGGELGETIVLTYEQLLTSGAEVFTLSAGDVVFVPQSLVSVMGSVSRPGEITFREGITLSRSIASAGGALPTANLRKVYVLRGDERIRVNVRRILDGRDVDFPLLAGDRVVIKESVF
jgi:polysaccharide export outer membrane protein